ncbi:MAG: YdeI family protein [Anaerolineales bacterium]
MAQPVPESKLLRISDRDKWREWLKKNRKSEDEIWLVYAKKHTGKPRISYNDAVEEALCFGWIDSIVKTIDEDSFAQRFSVRKSKSSYSQPNRERLRALVEQGKVMPDVLESLPDLSEDDFRIAPDILEGIKANKQAWKNFQGFSEPYIRIRISYIEAGRERSEIFEKRLANFISKTEKNKKFGYGGIEKYY